MDNMEGLKKFVPLAGVFLTVAVLTGLVTFARADYALMSVGQAFMAMFFLVFGGFKAYNLEGFRMAFREYDPLAERTGFYATIYPFLELALGLSYLVILFTGVPVFEIAVYSATAILMTVNGLGVADALSKGRHLKCACLGDVFNVPMTSVTLAEDLLMALMAVSMLVSVV